MFVPSVGLEFHCRSQRLQAAVKERAYAFAAKDTSAVRLQQVVFTQKRFYEGVEGWLHLYSHMVIMIKVSNESVVESIYKTIISAA